MKIYAYTPLHYGKEYLYHSIKSYEALVDKILIFYTDKPSFGTRLNLKCPDSQDELRAIAESASNKIEWHHVNANTEGQHRDRHKQYLSECDLMFTSDADEVWWSDNLEEAFKVAYDDKKHGSFGVTGKVDLWRSFDWQMVDGFAPVRILKQGAGQTNIECPYLHFGYAQSMSTIDYKLRIHGHLGDIRSVHGNVDNYLNKVRKWIPYTKSFYHPASESIWLEAEKYDKSQMPDLMKDHPYYNLTKIL